jgi:TonB-dependent SusC/RagA subfamily outer membrane receptor
MKRTHIYLLVIAFIFSTSLVAQNSGKKVTITGIVTDMNNQPIANAAILVDTKNSGIMTDSQGMYKIKVKAGATRIAVLSLSGGQADEEIAGSTVINFQLGGFNTTEVKDQPGDEIVNIGYGYSAKKDLTTSVRKIDSSIGKNANYSDIYEMLRGVDPSVQVGVNNKVIIRGAGSNISTDPLFLVDGVVVQNLDHISPQLVKSIEILKGADASIYGSRSANGVVMITLIGNN